MSKQSSEAVGRRWWSYGHVWLVVAGPLVVVVASFVTFYLAAHGQDPVLSTHAEATDGATGALAPAVQARNHAATGDVPAPLKTSKP
ncbi:MAG: nitrogen fixation protein FixH [Limnohabitans sp.]